MRAHAVGAFDQHLFVPQPREAPAGAVVGDLHVGQRGIAGDQRDLVLEAPAPLGVIGHPHGVAEVDLVDDRQHRDLEQDGVQPGTPHRDVDLARRARRGRHRHILLVHLEQAQEVDEVALDEAQRTQVVELALAKAQRAQVLDLFADLVDQAGQRNARVAALEAVLHLRARKVMQHHLHHGELVQIGVEQRVDDHGDGAWRAGGCQCSAGGRRR